MSDLCWGGSVTISCSRLINASKCISTRCSSGRNTQFHYFSTSKNTLFPITIESPELRCFLSKRTEELSAKCT